MLELKLKYISYNAPKEKKYPIKIVIIRSIVNLSH